MLPITRGRFQPYEWTLQRCYLFADAEPGINSKTALLDDAAEIKNSVG